jgi:hypothetical protein
MIVSLFRISIYRKNNCPDSRARLVLTGLSIVFYIYLSCIIHKIIKEIQIVYFFNLHEGQNRDLGRQKITWCTAKLELIPAPFISFPSTYCFLTDRPPIGHTANTLVGNAGRPSFSNPMLGQEKALYAFINSFSPSDKALFTPSMPYPTKKNIAYVAIRKLTFTINVNILMSNRNGVPKKSFKIS